MRTATTLALVVLSFSSTGLMANSNNPAMQNSNNPNTVTETIKINSTDPVEIILLDHKQITQMIDKLNKSLDSNVAASRTQFKSLQDFLVKHETMEQKAWYPQLEKNDQLQNIVTQLKDQEQDAEKALKEINSTKDDQAWVSKVKDFLKAVAQHANDEQTMLLPKVSQVLDKTKLNEIGKDMQAFRTKNNMN
jgi:hemerythrin superfamily protein